MKSYQKRVDPLDKGFIRIENADVRICIASSLFLCIFFSILLLTGTALSKEKEEFFKVRVLPKQVHQGDICVLNVLFKENSMPLTAEFQKKELLFYRVNDTGLFRALIGVDMEVKPGDKPLTITAKDGAGNAYKKIYWLKILKKDFGTQKLSLPRRMVELDKETLSRVRKESKRVKTIWPKDTKKRLWQQKFIMPLKGEVISPFGVRRILNDLPRSPHSGVDLRAKMGEKVQCSNTGIVVHVDEMYFSGKSVIVDHGQGLYTMYFHLSRIAVKKGQHVERGEILGLAGSSGRATGPHLHWGVRLRGARVNPLSLVQLKD